MILDFWASLSAFDAATWKLASIRDAVTFACWPPGPEEREARSSISASGMRKPARIGREFDTVWEGSNGTSGTASG
jgi:hypothetical protein